jgi:DNA-binding response OmpR family regulator
MHATTKQKHRLLIIDDDDDLRAYMIDNLQTFYHVFQAADGKEGWNKVLACQPDLIITDIKLPLLDGIQLSLKIKSDKRTCHLPVILLTALTREEEQIRGLNSGANDYLTKPFNFAILNVKIKNLLAQNDALKTIYSRRIIIQPPEVGIKSNGEKFMTAVTAYIHENIKSPKLNVANLSAHLGTSRVAIYNRIFELTGKPPVAFIRSYKLDIAAELILRSNLSLAEIAHEAGFATAHYFSKSFKDKFGVLLSEYRIDCKKLAN